VKDSITADLEAQIRNLQREILPKIPIQPAEPTVSKIEYGKLDKELQSTRKRLDGIQAEVICLQWLGIISFFSL
jgi:hypothetical protein